MGENIIPLADLRYETFGSSGRHAPQAFRVQIPRHRLDITVPADCSLLDALEGAGVQTLHDCKRGECGLCAMDVVAVDGTIDHRERRKTRDETARQMPPQLLQRTHQLRPHRARRTREPFEAGVVGPRQQDRTAQPRSAGHAESPLQHGRRDHITHRSHPLPPHPTPLRQADAARKELGGVLHSDHITAFYAYTGWLDAQRGGAAAEREYLQKYFLSKGAPAASAPVPRATPWR